MLQSIYSLTSESNYPPTFLPLLFEPFAYRLPVYGQYKFAIIGRILLHLEDVVFDFKLSSMSVSYTHLPVLQTSK